MVTAVCYRSSRQVVGPWGAKQLYVYAIHTSIGIYVTI